MVRMAYLPASGAPQNANVDALAEEEKKAAESLPSPGTNHVDDEEHETFLLGRPVEDAPEVESCKHCKKNVLKSGAKAHIAQCLRVKKEKAQRKKEAREARERAREAAREEEARKADEEGGKDDDSDDEDGDKGGKGTKTNKDPGKGGKKRKADGEAEKGPFKKKKKEDAKPKTAKPKGTYPQRIYLFIKQPLTSQQAPSMLSASVV